MKLRTLFMIMAISATTMGTALLSGCNSTSATAANAPLTTAKLGDYFVSTDWVAQHANDPNFVIVDTRTKANYDVSESLLIKSFTTTAKAVSVRASIR